MFGIDSMFWVGIAAVALVVIVGCTVAWLLPPKVRKEAQRQKEQ